MEQGTIVQWEKAEGDLLEEGDIIAQVETDKATMDMETPAPGYLAKILMPAGSKDLALGTVSDIPPPSLFVAFSPCGFGYTNIYVSSLQSLLKKKRTLPLSRTTMLQHKILLLLPRPHPQSAPSTYT